MTLGRGRNGNFPDGSSDVPLSGPTAPLSGIKIALPLPFSPILSAPTSQRPEEGAILDDKYALTYPSTPNRRLLPLSSNAGHCG